MLRDPLVLSWAWPLLYVNDLVERAFPKVFAQRFQTQRHIIDFTAESLSAVEVGLIGSGTATRF